jgi:hypothetical protein
MTIRTVARAQEGARPRDRTLCIMRRGLWALVIGALMAGCALEIGEPEDEVGSSARAVLVPQADADHDGWAPPADCNDHDDKVNPGASEICNNGIDDDCDGVVDEPECIKDPGRCTNCPIY